MTSNKSWDLDKDGNLIEEDTIAFQKKKALDMLAQFGRKLTPDQQKKIFLKRVGDILLQEGSLMDHYDSIIGLIYMYAKDMDLTGDLMGVKDVIID